MNGTREQIIEATAKSLEMQGRLGTRLNHVFKESGAHERLVFAAIQSE